MKKSPVSDRDGAGDAVSESRKSLEKPQRTPTIKEFADAIGVSPTTVSRSITRRGRISDETRNMVLLRMEELGYTPNLHAQRLVSRRANTVALCLGAALAPASDLFLAGLIRGLQVALQEHDNGLLILGPGDLLKRTVDSRAVDGVIVVGGGAEDAELARSIVRPEVPCIVIGTTPLEAEPHIGSVVIDMAGGGVKVARALFERGHRHIGFIGSTFSQSVLPAFRRELKDLGAPMRDEWVLIAGDTDEDGERAMNQLLALQPRPTAVFTRTDELGVGALRAARKLGVKVPEQLSIIGHDDLAYSRFSDPPLSTVRIDCDAVGKAVVALLFDLLAHPDTVFAPRLVPTELAMRQSVAFLQN